VRNTAPCRFLPLQGRPREAKPAGEGNASYESGEIARCQRGACKSQDGGRQSNVRCRQCDAYGGIRKVQQTPSRRERCTKPMSKQNKGGRDRCQSFQDIRNIPGEKIACVVTPVRKRVVDTTQWRGILQGPGQDRDGKTAAANFTFETTGGEDCLQPDESAQAERNRQTKAVVPPSDCSAHAQRAKLTDAGDCKEFQCA